MSHQGRGNNAICVAAAAMVVLLGCEVAQATTYAVGGAAGWTFNASSWPYTSPIKFYAGDILVFNYNPKLHNVVIVNVTESDNCDPGNNKVLDSGHDRIKLAKGRTFFISRIPGDCNPGAMHLDILAH